MISPMPLLQTQHRQQKRSASPQRTNPIEHRRETTESPCPCYGWAPAKVAVVLVNVSRLEPSNMEAIEHWPSLDQQVLLSSRSHQVCMTCQFFQHHPGPNGIPLLTCHLHQGLIAHGEHLTCRCSGWMVDMRRQRGWEPEVA